MNRRERAMLAGVCEVAYASRSSGGWNRLWQNAVGCSMGRDAGAMTHVEQGGGVAATIRAELTR